MKILIKEANQLMYSSKKFIGDDAGKWLTVETEHLFTNQYNTKDKRIMDEHVQAVREDARKGKGKCNYCGTILNEGEKCNKYRVTDHARLYLQNKEIESPCDEYGVKWFTPRNTYFLAYPNSMGETINLEGFEEKFLKFGSYTLRNWLSENDWYSLSNSRQRLVFQYDAMLEEFRMQRTGEVKRRLPIPEQAMRKLKKFLDEINGNPNKK